MRKLAALTERWRVEHERTALLFGMVCSVAANYSMRPPEKPLRPSDFVGKRPKQQAEEEAERKAAVDRRIEQLMRRMPGGVIVKNAAGEIVEQYGAVN